MTISDNYVIDEILTQLEIALQIDGVDYAEKDVNVIVNNVKTRIARQYNVDLKGTNITDSTLFIDKFRSASVLFVDNVTRIHSMLCGYLQIVRYKAVVLVRPIIPAFAAA